MRYLSKSFDKIHPSFRVLLENNYLDQLIAIDKILCDYADCGYKIYPAHDNIFRCLENIDLSSVRVVILGQDPYHGENQANGFAFMVDDNISLPPSLKNILKELVSEYKYKDQIVISYLLSKWVSQGVLLLNNSLSVLANQPGSMSNIGWSEITDGIIKAINLHAKHVVFMLWGNHAQTKLPLINTDVHVALKSAHPSPLSCYRGFFGCNHFMLANEHIKFFGGTPIEWL